jgi:glycosyltransferase involved in cell wall biosynthesis
LQAKVVGAKVFERPGNPARSVRVTQLSRRSLTLAPRLTVTVIVCAHNEEAYVAGCLHSLLAQTRTPDEILVINNASVDATGDVARRVPGVRVVDEPQKGLVKARERGRREARGSLLVYVDADCRAPLFWLQRVVAHFERKPTLIALSGNYRFYDWDWWGRTLLRAYDLTLGPATQVLVKYILRKGVVFYGGNFAVRREALDQIGGFDTTIEFHGEDTNLGRRLFAIGRVELAYDCQLFTSARRYNVMGKGAVFRLYVRNFVSEILYHRPKDSAHVDVRTRS